MMIVKQLVTFVITIGFVFPCTGAVKPLTNALNAGKVCERTDGFIQATPGHENEMGEFVASINAERANVYAEIAKTKGTDPASVAALSAEDVKHAHSKWMCR